MSRSVRWEALWIFQSVRHSCCTGEGNVETKPPDRVSLCKSNWDQFSIPAPANLSFNVSTQAWNVITSIYSNRPEQRPWQSLSGQLVQRSFFTLEDIKMVEDTVLFKWFRPIRWYYVRLQVIKPKTVDEMYCSRWLVVGLCHAQQHEVPLVGNSSRHFVSRKSW